MNDNGWFYNRSARRFEYLADGQIIAVDVLEGGSTEGLPEGVVAMTAPANIRAVASRFAAGDEAAGDELDSLLASENEPYQTDVQAATGQGTQAQQGQGGMLPSPDFINAQVDVFTIASNITDAAEKLRQREEAVARKYQGYGRSMPNIAQGSDQGPFPTTPAAISELAGSNPDYIRAFGGINNLAAGIEINRRQNALAAADTEITNYADWDSAVAEYDALLAERTQLAEDMDRDAAATLQGTSNENYAAVQQKGWRTKNSTLAAIDAKLKALGTRINRHPEAGKWFEELNLQKAYAGTLEAGSIHRDTIGQEIPNEWLPYEQQRKPIPKPGETIAPPAWTANVPQGAAPDLRVFGTPEQHGQTAPPPAPSYTAPPKPAAVAAPAPTLTAPMPKSEQPPRPPAAGMRWEKRGEQWVEVPIETPEPNAGAPLPTYAEGGMVGWGWTQGGGGETGGVGRSSNPRLLTSPTNPVPAGGSSRQGGPPAPVRPRQPGDPMDPVGRDRALLELERQQIEQQYQADVARLGAMHRARMAQFSTQGMLNQAGGGWPAAQAAAPRPPMPAAGITFAPPAAA